MVQVNETQVDGLRTAQKGATITICRVKRSEWQVSCNAVVFASVILAVSSRFMTRTFDIYMNHSSGFVPQYLHSTILRVCILDLYFSSILLM